MPSDKDDLLPVRLPHLGSDGLDPAPIHPQVAEGAVVRRGDPVVEVEGAKAVSTLCAPADGVIVSMSAAEELPVGEVIYTLRLAELPPTSDDHEDTRGARALETAVRWPWREPGPLSPSEVVRRTLCLRVLDALPAAPPLLRRAMSAPGELPLRLRVVESEGSRWWHATLWLGSYEDEVARALQEGPGPPTWLTLSLRLEPGGVVEPVEGGLEILFEPLISSPGDRWPRARVLLRLEPGHPAQHLEALANALDGEFRQ